MKDLMMPKVAIRYASHENPDMVGRNRIILNPGRNKVAEIKNDLNAFFASENLPYYAAIVEDGYRQ